MGVKSDGVMGSAEDWACSTGQFGSIEFYDSSWQKEVLESLIPTSAVRSLSPDGTKVDFTNGPSFRMTKKARPDVHSIRKKASQLRREGLKWQKE